MYNSLFIASLEPLDKDGWNDLLDWTDSEIAGAVHCVDYVDLITDENICVDDLKCFKYLTVETKDENNLTVTISKENRQRCREWKADVYQRYADDLKASNPYSQNREVIDAIENKADFFLPTYGSLDIYSEYSENLPNKFYICRTMFYDYHICRTMFYDYHI